MSSIVYEEVPLAEMTYEDSEQMYYYECPCGDKFEISLEDLYDGEDTAPCPSCTLQIRVVFNECDLPELRPEEEEEEEDEEEGQEEGESVLKSESFDVTPMVVPAQA